MRTLKKHDKKEVEHLDKFYEQLITTTKTKSYNLVNSLVYILGLAAILFASYSIIFGIMLAVVAAVCYFGKKYLYIEYEYNFTNGEVDIDRIYEMKKRKRVVTFQMKAVEIMAPESNTQVKDLINKNVKVENLYPKTSKAQIFSAVVASGAQRIGIRFVPDEEFLRLAYKYNPRAVKPS